MRIEALVVHGPNDAWLQLSRIDIWHRPATAVSAQELVGQVRASLVGPVRDVELFPAAGAVSDALTIRKADPASFFQAALMADEGTQWTIRTHSGQPARSPEAMGLKPIPGHENAWVWSLVDAVGQCSVDWLGIRVPILALDRKMPGGEDRVEQLERLLSDIWRRHHALLRRLGVPASIRLDARGYRARAPIHTLMLLDQLVWHQGVHEAWEAVATEPMSALDVTWPSRPVSRAQRPCMHGPRGPWSLADGWRPGRTAGLVRDRQPTRHFDTPPNRLALRLAREVEGLCDDVLRALANSEYESAQGWRKVARRTRERARRVRAAPALSEVEPFAELALDTPMVQLNPTCRPLLRAWTTIRQGLTIDQRLESKLHDPLKEAWELYEYWCWFALCDAIDDVAGQKGRAARIQVKTLDRFVGEGVLEWGLVHQVTLRENRIRTYYNMSAQNGSESPYSSYSRSFRPDIALEVSTPAGDVLDLTVFDAKYRVMQFHDAQGADGELKRQERRGIAKTDDLKVMHAYKDALCSRNGNPPRWVLTLFPGTELVLYSKKSGRSRNAQLLGSPDVGGVGALPCRPLTSDHDFLGDSIRALLAPYT